MRTKVRVSYGGVQLDSLDDSIIIQRVDELAPQYGQTLTSRGNGYGQIQTAAEKKYRDVTVRFAIAEFTDLVRRQEVLQAVRDWAAVSSGWLLLNYRADQRLYVRCVAMPAVNGIRKAADEYAVTFRTTARPEWEARTANTAEAKNKKTGSVILKVTPSGGGRLRMAAVNNTSSVCNSVTISIGSQKIALTSLGLAAGETLQISYVNETDIQRIRIQNTAGSWRSVLNKRSADSSDDIILAAGSNTISISSSVNLTWTLSCYGVWPG